MISIERLGVPTSPNLFPSYPTRGESADSCQSLIIQRIFEAFVLSFSVPPFGFSADLELGMPICAAVAGFNPKLAAALSNVAGDEILCFSSDSC